MSDTPPATQVADAPVDHRYELRVDGALAGIAAYERGAGVVTFTHTVIEPAFEGRGLGGLLARAALDDARDRDERVVAQCSFIRGWIERHPDYADLVAR